MRTRPAGNPAVRYVAIALVVIGAAMAIASLFADQLNLTGGGVGLGWKQLIATIVGLVLLLIGLGWLLQPPMARDIDESME